MQAYTKPLSLWQLVEQHVHPHEQEEIKDMLGASLVEQSQELHEEIDMLLDIWREMRDETSDPGPSVSLLPEPPNQRDRLVQEICFFLDNVKAKAEEKGIDPQHFLKKHNSEILDYATEVTRPGSSLSRTSHSSDGRETPMMPVSADRINLAVGMTDEVEAVNKQLNYLEFDQVCASLRSTLEKEVETLLQDIQFLQGCLDSAADVRDCMTPRLTSREPTLTELREERALLEKELLSADGLRTTPIVNKPTFNTINKPLPRTPPGKSDSQSPTGKPGPMRANHSIIGPARVKYDNSGQSFSVGSQVLSVRPSSAEKSTSLIQSPREGNASSGRAGKQNLPSSSSNSSASTAAVGLPSKLRVLPTPPQISPSLSDNEMQPVKAQRYRSHGATSLHGVPEQNQVIPAHSETMTRDGVTVKSGGAQRRTVSPGRVRVVDLSKIVDIHSGKGVTGVDNFSSSASSSTPSTTFTPSPPTTSLDRDASLRPSSAHADRFRKMVLGCRDGE